MPAEKKAFPLRLDPALHAAVARLATAELRSINGQIEYLLREALRARGVKISGDAVDDEEQRHGGGRNRE